MESELRLRMAAARTNKGLTQKEMAERMGVSNTTINNWETGRVSPKPAQFKMYCDICEVPVDVVILPTT